MLISHGPSSMAGLRPAPPSGGALRGRQDQALTRGTAGRFCPDSGGADWASLHDESAGKRRLPKIRSSPRTTSTVQTTCPHVRHPLLDRLPQVKSLLQSHEPCSSWLNPTRSHGRERRCGVVALHCRPPTGNCREVTDSLERRERLISLGAGCQTVG